MPPIKKAINAMILFVSFDVTFFECIPLFFLIFRGATLVMMSLPHVQFHLMSFAYSSHDSDHYKRGANDTHGEDNVQSSKFPKKVISQEEDMLTYLWIIVAEKLLSRIGFLIKGPTKHVEVDRHFIKDRLKKGSISTPFIQTKDQLVDIFTKSLSGAQIYIWWASWEW